MTALEPQAIKRSIILNTRENLAQQIKDAQETAQPLVFTIESELGTHSILTINLTMYVPTDIDDDLLYARTERQEKATVFIPKDHGLPAYVDIPN